MRCFELNKTNMTSALLERGLAATRLSCFRLIAQYSFDEEIVGDKVMSTLL